MRDLLLNILLLCRGLRPLHRVTIHLGPGALGSVIQGPAALVIGLYNWALPSYIGPLVRGCAPNYRGPVLVLNLLKGAAPLSFKI